MAENNDKISRLQMYEQSLQNLLLQKQQFQGQMSEVEAALGELPSAKTTYKIIGNIMVDTKKEDLQKSLEEKKQKAEIRIKALEKQEAQIKEKTKELQEEIMKEMKQDG
jgi:prefoldin beta subunit